MRPRVPRLRRAHCCNPVAAQPGAPLSLALPVALLAVALGAALGLGIGSRALGPARIIAALVALGAVVFQLAPEAVAEVGWAALIVLGVGAALPFGLTALVRGVASQLQRPSLPDGALGDHAALGLELAYAGLLVHQLGDGIALGALGSHAHDHGHEVSLAAIGIHAVALSAVFVLAFRDRRGWRHALLRAGGMAAVLCGGALFAGVLPAAFLHVAHPWIAAATAGLLLHVAAHPLLDALTAQPAHAPR